MSKLIFEKNYTRDTSLIIQQIWLEANSRLINEYFPDNKEIFGLDYLNNGVIEIWENKNLLANFKQKLAEMSFTHKQEFLKILNWHLDELPGLTKIWDKQILPINDLVKFIDKVNGLMSCNIIYSYLGIEENVEPEVKYLAAKIRGKDHFFSSTDLVFRESLKKIYPEMSGLVTCIRKEEIGNPPPKDELEKRYQHFIYQDDGNYFTEDIQAFKDRNTDFVFEEEEAESADAVKGVVANRGVAKGRVVIVSRIDQVGKIKSGDIVVSPMTIPAMVTGLKKAGAIVTDEGGMLCHAAVVSREFGIPCVIGTKIATKIFKDGDLVEVDANAGVVRKI